MVVLRRIVRILVAAGLIAWSAALTAAWWQPVRAIEPAPFGSDLAQTLFPTGFLQTLIAVGVIAVAIVAWFGVLATAAGSVPGAFFALLPAIAWWGLRLFGQVPQAGLGEWLLRGQDLWGAAVLITLLIAAKLPWRGSQRRQQQSAITAATIRNTRSWGVPGNSGAVDEDTDAGSFGSDSAPIGRVGDRRVGLRLEDLVDTPSARLIHALRFLAPGPAGVDVDVDHAVVVGNRVALVEVKVWQPGIYTWYGSGTLLRYGERFRNGRSDLVEAARRLRDRIGSSTPGLDVQAWLVVTPVGDAERHTYVLHDDQAPARARMCHLSDLEELRDWLAGAASSDTVRTDLITDLVLAHQQHPASAEPALHPEDRRQRFQLLPALRRHRGRHQLRVGDHLVG